LAGIGGAFMLARTTPVVFAATLLTALSTFLFAIAYGISEVEPYMVPVYIMIAVWLGGGAVALHTWSETRDRQQTEEGHTRRRQWLQAGAAAVAVLALVSIVIQYPRQNHRDDRLAEQFVENVFSTLPQNSILITDYWDFYAPTYYMQQVRGLRPDITIIDKSLLRYPWYLEQLARRHPFLVENSSDVAQQFRAEQRKWVDGEPFDSALLDRLYMSLLTSFVERNSGTHSAFLLMLPPCDAVPAHSRCDNNQIAPGHSRQVYGLATRLLPAGNPPAALPAEPTYAVRGIVGSQVPMDEFARINSEAYARAYRRLGQLYTAANDTERASRMLERAEQIEQALEIR
ncbi:MAG TPA: hypothetical protein VEY08_07695, partial [Chloroflexia bacterium]|nr:hypothetical protein [Chloroflexia bacterium]